MFAAAAYTSDPSAVSWGRVGWESSEEASDARFPGRFLVLILLP